MGFASGSITFRKFNIVAHGPKVVTQEMLDKIAQTVPNNGNGSDVSWCWSGGRHVLDNEFSFENNVFGDAISFALRVDTNKVPGDIKKAYLAIEEEAFAKQNPSGFISKIQKRQAKDNVNSRCDHEIKNGKWAKSKIYPILWDLARGCIYCSVSGATEDQLREVFYRTFELELAPTSAGKLADQSLSTADFENIIPQKWGNSGEDPGKMPEYPWSSKAQNLKDYLGNEFLVWLWHEIDVNGGSIATAKHSIDVFFDKTLELDCAYGENGRDTLRGDGPHKMVEAKHALASGKVPRKVGMMIVHNSEEFKFTFNPESFTFSGAKLPEVEKADTARVLFEERITLLADMVEGVQELYAQFLRDRTDSLQWIETVDSIRSWLGVEVDTTANDEVTL